MKKYYYLVHIQYLGFRYHGWMKQPGVKTIESMVEKTLGFILGHTRFKILGASRTDAKVSAHHSAFELFVREPLNTRQLLRDFDLNLPNDIKVSKVEAVDSSFNILNSPESKEYIYLFSYGEKPHPFCASLMSSFMDELDIDLMKQGAGLFLGKHNFTRYCTKPKPGAVLEREIQVSRIEENKLFFASFFPPKSWVYHIRSRGFLRYQVRLIMGQLLRLGRGETQLDDIKASLTGEDHRPFRHIASGSGLILNKIKFK